jgi:hypothetical protein
MENRWIKAFIKLAGAILLVAALIRFSIAAGNAQFLLLPDPLLGIPLRYAVLIVGGIELGVALICLFGKQIEVQIAWLAWMGANYILFRIGLLLMHCHPQATCIGSLTDPLRLSRGIIGFIMEIMPFFLVLGSYTAVVWFWLKGGLPKTIESLKISCHSCGVHIEFAVQYIGRKISCPHCQAIITLRKPENLKTSCFFCKEHIEFPSHALGRKIPCPHCKMDITLTEPA